MRSILNKVRAWPLWVTALLLVTINVLFYMFGKGLLVAFAKALPWPPKF